MELRTNHWGVLLCSFVFMCCGNDVEEYTPVSPTTPTKPVVEIDYRQRAEELMSLIEAHYKIKDGTTAGLYRENYPQKEGDLATSYLWPYDGLVSGTALLYELGVKVNYPQMVDRFDAYYLGEPNHIPGYASQTNGLKGSGTRFYDDNSIVGLDLVEAYRLTKDEHYLQRAGEIVKFLHSGTDDKFGGGLWWNEDQKDMTGVNDSNKPTCANGYATLFLLEYATVCPASEKTEVLKFAQSLYTWLTTNLQDPEDHCYWNDKQSDGSINKTKWTYNTGVMISSGIRLYRITGENRYIDQAIASADGAYNYFVRPIGKLALSYPDHDPWFNVKLAKAFIELIPYHPNTKNYVETFINNLNYAYDHARTTAGFYFEDWTGASEKRKESLLMQAAALESLGLIAKYKKQQKLNN